MAVKKSKSPNGGTHKTGGSWTNGSGHGKFKTKAGADAQRKAMFANGYKVKKTKKSK